MAEVIWTEPALDQLNAILEFIALDSPDAAQAVGRRVFAATDRLALFPKMGRPIPEFPHKGYRQVWVKPFWLYYRAEENRTIVLHMRRSEKLLRTGDLLKEEGCAAPHGLVRDVSCMSPLPRLRRPSRNRRASPRP